MKLNPRETSLSISQRLAFNTETSNDPKHMAKSIGNDFTGQLARVWTFNTIKDTSIE